MLFRGILGKVAFTDPRKGHCHARALIFQSKCGLIGFPAPPTRFLNSTRCICMKTIHSFAPQIIWVPPPCAPHRCRPGQCLPRLQVLVQSDNKKSISGSSYGGLLGGSQGHHSARATITKYHRTSRWQVAISSVASHGLFSARAHPQGPLPLLTRTQFYWIKAPPL